jgi:hypothetical protein
VAYRFIHPPPFSRTIAEKHAESIQFCPASVTIFDVLLCNYQGAKVLLPCNPTKPSCRLAKRNGVFAIDARESLQKPKNCLSAFAKERGEDA